MRSVSIAVALAGIICGLAAVLLGYEMMRGVTVTGLSTSHDRDAEAVNAGDCSGNPNVIGTSRIIAVDPTEHPSVGRMQYPESLPLADKEIVLTFDDGPWPPATTRILDLLASECVKATYFILGRSARANPQVVRRIYAEGHTLGTHSQTHPSFDNMPIESVRNEVEQGIVSTTSAVGNPTALAPFFRIPNLARTPAVESYLHDRGLMIWSADIAADDWMGIPANEVLDLAFKRIEIARKGILILHDVMPATAQAMPSLLKGLKARGYRIVHVVPAGTDRPKTVTMPQDWMNP